LQKTGGNKTSDRNNSQILNLFQNLKKIKDDEKERVKELNSSR
jgi:hypothetical protein